MKRSCSILTALTTLVFVAVSATAIGRQEPLPTRAARDFQFVSIWPETEGAGFLLTELSERYRAEVNPAFNVEFEFVPRDSLVRRIRVLMASNDLPDLFAYEAGEPLVEAGAAGVVPDFDPIFRGLGLSSRLRDEAVELLRRWSPTGKLHAIPHELNLEGFWYNRQLFALHGVDVPRTWREMLAAAERLYEDGVQPFAVAGADMWQVTRLVNSLVARTLGPDAMQRVADGSIPYDHPGLIWAAAQVQTLAERGYFGEGVDSIDSRSALESFLNGEAAMHYTGSWVTENYNDPQQNRLPEGTIGLFSVPEVEGGKGSLHDYPMNTGIVLTMSSARLDNTSREWMHFVFSRYGDLSMAKFGTISGFKLSDHSISIPRPTALALQHIDSVRRAFPSFEAFMDREMSEAAHRGTQLLILGDISPEEFWERIDVSAIAVP